jgi:hypothetical protein
VNLVLVFEQAGDGTEVDHLLSLSVSTAHGVSLVAVGSPRHDSPRMLHRNEVGGLYDR